MAADLGINQFSTRNVSESLQRPEGALVGRLAGHEVRETPSPQSLMSDAAEELTFSVDNTEELELKERPQKEPVRADGLLAKVKFYQELMWQREGMKNRLALLRQFLLNNSEPRAALDRAREYFPDPSQAWAALRELQEELDGDGAPPEVQLALTQALERLEREDGARIRAGLAGALAGLDHPDLGPPLELGESYRRVSCDFRDAVEMLEHVLNDFGPGRFEEALGFLLKSLAGDLTSAADGAEKAHLETVGRGLGQVRILKSAYVLNERLLDRWARVHGVPSAELTPMGLLKEVLSLGRESYVPQARLEDLSRRARPPDIEREVLFWQEFLATARSFSPQLFDGPESRIKFIGAVQEAVDGAIAREDEYLASLEEES